MKAEPAPLKLRNLTKAKSKPKEQEEEKPDEFDEFSLDEAPSLRLVFDVRSMTSFSSSKIDLLTCQKLFVSIKGDRVKEKIDAKVESKVDEKKSVTKSGREKRFFKSRKEEPKYVIPSFTEETEKTDAAVFKMPSVPIATDTEIPGLVLKFSN